MNIEFQQVCYTYPTLSEQSREALRNVSFQIAPGEMAAIAGASGSGKTTLIQHLNGLIAPTSGRILLDDADLKSTTTDLWHIRRRVGLVFQFPELQFFEETVAEEIAYGLKNQGLSSRNIQKHLSWALETVGLDAGFLKKHPFHLSGGEQRRVALASVLAMGPEVLALDEPTAGLDWRGVQQIEQILREIHAAGKTVIFVTHDMDLITRLAQRVLVLSRGELLFDGDFKRLFQHSEVLKQARLRLPEVMGYMREHFPDEGDVFTAEEAKRVISRFARGHGP